MATKNKKTDYPKLNEIVELHEKTQKALKDKLTEMVPHIFQEFFEKNPNINTMVIKGYTPSFNYGDPCTHSQAVLIDDEMVEFLENKYDDEGEKISFVPNNIPEDESSWDITAPLDGLESILAVVYGTDWFLILKRDESAFGYSVKTREYNPDY